MAYDETVYENERAIDDAAASRKMQPAAQQPQPRINPNQAAQPTRMKIPGANTNGMTNPEIANQIAWEMQPRWHKQYQMKNQYRGMTDMQRRQAIEQTVQRHAAFSGLTGRPPAENVISLHVPTGATLDQHMGMDYNELSPEARTMYDEGSKRFRKEFARLMSGTDNTSWKTTADYEKALNNLQSVRDFGHLIESDVFGTARRFLSPEMKIRFDANDRTFDSFRTWADKNGIDTPEAIWADDESPQAREIKKRFYDDPGYEKWRERNGKLELVPITPEQQTRMRNKANAENEAEKLARSTESAEATIGQLAPEMQKQFMVVGGKPVRLPTAGKTLDEQEKELTARGEDVKKNYHIEGSASGQQFYKRNVDAALARKEGKAELVMQSMGMHVPVDANGHPDVSTDSLKKANMLVDKDGNPVPKVRLTMLPEKQGIESGEYKYARKPGVKYWEGSTQPQQGGESYVPPSDNPVLGQKPSGNSLWLAKQGEYERKLGRPLTDDELGQLQSRFGGK